MIPLQFIVDNLAFPSGILIAFSSSKIYKSYITLILLITVIYIFVETQFYLLHIHDLKESTTSMGTLSFTVTSFFRVVLLLKNNERLQNLILDIRQINTRRPSSNNDEAFVAERKSRITSIILLAMAYLTLLFMMVSPLVNMYREMVNTGVIVKHRWEFPYKMS